MTNKEAADILRLMPKQSDAILKAIEVLESENYYKSLAESYGETINKLTTAISKTKQEPFINNSCIYIRVCEHSKNKVLDKIRAEIEYKQEIQLKGEDISEWNKCIKEVLEVVDKYKESEEWVNFAEDLIPIIL